MGLNLSGTFNLLRLLRDPSLILPHHTVSTFNHLPVPLSSAFRSEEDGKADIRAVVLDKDNCFAAPKADVVYPAYKDRFQALKQEFPGARLLIVSNTAGSSSDPADAQSELLSQNTGGVHVLRHRRTKKPGCATEVLRYFQTRPETGVTSPAQVVVVGDRLFTDVMMANMMGARSIWIKDGVVKSHGLFTRIEQGLSNFLLKRGYEPPNPSFNAFES